MNLKEKFESELFSLITSYENKYNVSIEKVDLKKERDSLGEKIADIDVTFKELHLPKQEEKKVNFLTHVLFPTIIMFFILSFLLDIINNQ